MKHSLLKELMPSDKTKVVRDLEASLEAIWKMDAEERARTEISNDLVQLGLKVRRDFPEDHPLAKAINDALQVASIGLDSNIPSMEGLKDIFFKIPFLGKRRKPSAEDIDPSEGAEYSKRYKAIKQFVAELDKTYLNKSWVSKQKFVTEPVNASDIGKNFEIDGKEPKDPLKNFETVQHRITKFIHDWEPHYLNLSNEVIRIHKALLKDTAGAAVGDVAKLALVKKAIAEMNALSSPLAKLPKFEGTSFANMTIKGEGDEVSAVQTSKPNGVDTLDPLDEHSIIAAATLVKQIMTYVFFSEPEFGHWLDFETDSSFSNWLQDSDESLYFKYYDRYDVRDAPVRYIYAIYDLTNDTTLAASLIRWIDRSIK